MIKISEISISFIACLNYFTKKNHFLQLRKHRIPGLPRCNGTISNYNV